MMEDSWYLEEGAYDVDGLVVSGSKETEKFDPEIGKWTAAAPMSEKRSNHVAIKLDDGKVFVIGGGKLERTLFKILRNI
ncbi:MAG: hypothetical protein CM1200mP8_2420 [Chloroflexota bacterium]|nr:MAG: hypothetical protein CM1200mP8_2420 [Chloroflexota bacterium]